MDCHHGIPINFSFDGEYVSNVNTMVARIYKPANTPWVGGVRDVVLGPEDFKHEAERCHECRLHVSSLLDYGTG